MKNAVVLTLPFEISVAPNQNAKAVAKKMEDWAKAYSKLDQIAFDMDRLKGSSKVSRYDNKQLLSLVKDATVRIAAAISQANCADSSCAFLLRLSFTTIDCYEENEINSEN